MFKIKFKFNNIDLDGNIQELNLFLIFLYLTIKKNYHSYGYFLDFSDLPEDIKPYKKVFSTAWDNLNHIKKLNNKDKINFALLSFSLANNTKSVQKILNHIRLEIKLYEEQFLLPLTNRKNIKLIYEKYYKDYFSIDEYLDILNTATIPAGFKIRYNNIFKMFYYDIFMEKIDYDEFAKMLGFILTDNDLNELKVIDKYSKTFEKGRNLKKITKL